LSSCGSATRGRASVRNTFDEKQLQKGLSLAALTEAKVVDEIVIASRDRRGLPIDDLLDCKLKGVNITEYLTFWERETGQIDLEALQPSWLFFSDGFRMDWFPNLLKTNLRRHRQHDLRRVDGAVIAVTAFAIRLEGPGPIFYVQERVGLHGKRFVFSSSAACRSMPRRMACRDGRANNDQRITRIGALIRKTRIDEIPQILNVLRGDMSSSDRAPSGRSSSRTLTREIPYYSERHRVRPGISGWRRSTTLRGPRSRCAGKLTYDLYYVKNRSLFLDFVILLQTARVVLWPEGVR